MTFDDINGLEDAAWTTIPPDTRKRLFALARIGAAVKPRPIKEAPKDDTVLVWISPGPNHSYYKDGEHSSWREHYIDDKGVLCETGNWLPIIGGADGIWQGTHFISLSALPTPDNMEG